MEYLNFIFETFWTFWGTILILLILTNSVKRVFNGAVNEITKLITSFKKINR